MGFPIRTCVQCGEEFELRPEKPGFANRCWQCSEDQAEDAGSSAVDAEQRRQQAAMDEARRGAIRDLLYRKDS